MMKVMNHPVVTVQPLKWSQTMKFLALRQKIESETDQLALDGADRKSESAWFAIGRMFANRKWLTILVAKDGDELIGYISIFFARFRKMKGNAYLVLSVRENYRGQGIGTKLMRSAETVAKGRNIRRLELEVFAKNTGAHKLFKRLGYEEEGRKRQVAQIQTGFDDLILMAKFLTPEPFVFRELERNELFDPLTISSAAPFTQAQFYGHWQEDLGQEVKRFIVSRNEEVIAYFQSIKYSLWRDKNYFYLPYGPILKEFSEPLLKLIRDKLHAIAKRDNAVFVRLDFTPTAENDESRELLSKFFTKSPLITYHSAHFQPRAEWILDLTPPEGELLKAMHEKTRYSVRLAERKGIVTEIITTKFEKYFETFHELMAGTAKRNGFSLHHQDYYQNIFKNLQADNAYLVIARSGEKILVIKLIIRHGQTAFSVFSGSSNDHRDWRPTYLVQWEAIRQAKKLGHNFYNFGGISFGKIYQGWEGLTIFKKGFGGREISHSDFFDIVAQPFWYRLYNFRKFVKNWLR